VAAGELAGSSAVKIEPDTPIELTYRTAPTTLLASKMWELGKGRTLNLPTSKQENTGEKHKAANRKAKLNERKLAQAQRQEQTRERNGESAARKATPKRRRSKNSNGQAKAQITRQQSSTRGCGRYEEMAAAKEWLSADANPNATDRYVFAASSSVPSPHLCTSALQLYPLVVYPIMHIIPPHPPLHNPLQLPARFSLFATVVVARRCI
jgi:hypothetical protein